MALDGRVCYGYHHKPGTFLSADNFFVRRSGSRAGEFYPQCKRCHKWGKNHPKFRGSVGFTPIPEFMPILMQLYNRIGQVSAAKRMGIAYDTISLNRLAKKKTVRTGLVQAAVKVLEDAIRAGEDGWSIHEARLRNLNPQLAGIASGKHRRRRIKEREEEMRKAKKRLGARAEFEFEEFYAKLNPVDMSEPDNQWWIHDGMQFVPRWGAEMLGVDF